MRKVGEYFHVFNRGVEKRDIFLDRQDLDRFLASMIAFNTLEPVGSLFELNFQPRQKIMQSSKPLVDIVCYCLNPNHFHILACAKTENGISKFIQRLSAGYTRYFNIRYRRNGVLFQGKYKSVPVTSNEQLLRLSAYINLNNRVHRLGTRSTKSSWDEYVNEKLRPNHASNIILDQFKNREEYKKFAEEALENIWHERGVLKELEKDLVD